MAKDYRKKSPARRSTPARTGGGSKQFVWVLVSFFCGYLVSTVFDVSAFSDWLKTNVLAKQDVKVAKPATQIAATTQIPKPKFEFYTLLASEHTATPVTAVNPAAASSTAVTTLANRASPMTVPVTTATPTVIAPTQKTPAALAASAPALMKESYLVQIASFRSKQDAEHMKASLILKGFTVNIATINTQQINWYRVIIGPFASRTQAAKAQGAIAQSEHIMGMIRKMDA